MALDPKRVGKPAGAPNPKPAKPKRDRRIITKHEGSATSYQFADQSGVVAINFATLPDSIKLKLMQNGAQRVLFNNKATVRDVQERIAKLARGEWHLKEPAPKLPDVLAEAMAHYSQKQGKGLLSQERFDELCSVEAWVKVVAKMPKAKKTELRANDYVQAELRLVKAARAKAKGAEATLDLDALAG